MDHPEPVNPVDPAARAAAPEPAHHEPENPYRIWWMAGLLLGPCVLIIVLRDVLPAWAVTPPESWRVPFIEWINAVIEFLRKTPIVGDFTFRDGTRAVAGWIEWPLDALEGLLITGFADGAVPALPWTMLAGLAAVWGWYLHGWRLGLLAGGCVLYLALFGKWKLSMITLSAVLVAAPVAGAIGLGLGILAVKWRRFERILWPVLNVMQSLPHFSYLIPVAVFIGVSHKAGTIATILFAIPPMARLTILGLRSVSPEVIEAGIMAGCTRFQMLHKVEIPAARPTIMVGVNQVIMQCLAMVVIASFIGARGLGHDLLFRLQSLRIGQALEIGVAIVFMAVTLDRLSQALAAKEPEHVRKGAWWRVHPFLGAAAAVVAVTAAATFVTPYASALPRELTLTTAPFWDGIVDWVTVNLFDPLNLFRDALLLNVLIPMRSGYQAVPWLAVAVLVGSIGWYLGRARIALLVLGYFAFVMLAGFWGPVPDHRLHGLVRGSGLRLDRGAGRDLGLEAGVAGEAGPAPVRYLPDLSVVHLPDPGDHAVQGRRCRRHLRDRDLCVDSRGPLHDDRTPVRSPPHHRGGDHVRVHAAPDPVEGPDAARVSRDHAGCQPDHHVRAVHGDHRRVHRDP